ncbi:hypothetical protein AVEN_117459-1 [Araneus ventricosus]|uniref:Uncharacterized protein n=1 Tax=Araneus ventricosus TaxID=182803 RepID=A0A4Y2HUF4_ARAVE|nr:hypothetical protein AVEN_117459-1 [Araneus ventricosus]
MMKSLPESLTIETYHDKEESCDNNLAEKGPSSEEAFQCIELTVKWLKQHEDSDVVKLLQDLVEKKRDSSLKQNFGLLCLNYRPPLMY